MAKRSFQYEERPAESLRERANARSGDFDSYINPKYRMYKVKAGKNLIRILPPTWDIDPKSGRSRANHYGYDIHVNYQVGPDNQSYLSLSRMKSQRDPIDEARQLAEREKDEELAKQLRPTKRILMWVIDRMAEDDGPLLWAAPFTVDKAFANLAIDEDTGAIVRVDSPTKGCDIRFYKDGEGMLTKYDASKMKLLERSPLSDDDDKMGQWLDYVTENPVPDCLQFYSYDHIAAVYNGKSPGIKSDEDEKPQHRSQDIIEPDGEDEEPPAPRKGKPVADEDSPWKDDEGDEEPAPKRGRPKLADPDEEPQTGSIRDRIRKRHQANREAD